MLRRKDGGADSKSYQRADCRANVESHGIADCCSYRCADCIADRKSHCSAHQRAHSRAYASTDAASVR